MPKEREVPVAPTIPQWLKGYLHIEDLEKIRHLIKHLENQTGAELVPIVVRSSIDFLIFRNFLIAASLALSLLLSPIILARQSWNSILTTEVVYLGCGIIMILLALWLSNRSAVVKFLFSPERLHQSVYQRACFEFFSNHLYATNDRTAVLFMYSILERKAMIIADPNLTSISKEVWEKAIAQMLTAAKKKQFYTGFQEALTLTAKELAAKVPPRSNNPNEIPDLVLIKD